MLLCLRTCFLVRFMVQTWQVVVFCKRNDFFSACNSHQFFFFWWRTCWKCEHTDRQTMLDLMKNSVCEGGSSQELYTDGFLCKLCAIQNVQFLAIFQPHNWLQLKHDLYKKKSNLQICFKQKEILLTPKSKKKKQRKLSKQELICNTTILRHTAMANH